MLTNNLFWYCSYFLPSLLKYSVTLYYAYKFLCQCILRYNLTVFYALLLLKFNFSLLSLVLQCLTWNEFDFATWKHLSSSVDQLAFWFLIISIHFSLFKVFGLSAYWIWNVYQNMKASSCVFTLFFLFFFIFRKTTENVAWSSPGVQLAAWPLSAEHNMLWVGWIKGKADGLLIISLRGELRRLLGDKVCYKGERNTFEGKAHRDRGDENKGGGLGEGHRSGSREL